MLDFTNLKKSIDTLDKLLAKFDDRNLIAMLDDTVLDGLVSGVIQNFEVCYELAWKYIKRYLEQNIGNTYIDGASRRELFRLAMESLLIDDIEKWMIYHRARNETSHTYDGVTAREVFTLSKHFVNDAKKLLHNLEIKND